MRLRFVLIAIMAIAGLAMVNVSAADQAQAAVSSAAPKPGVSVPYYVVQPSVDGQPEFLFEIAQRFLGEGNRFNEIFALNKGRKQADGGALTVATSLDPGWVLQMPADAKGAGLKFGPLPSVTAVPPSTAPSASPHASATQPATKHSTAPVASASSSGGVPLGLWVTLIIVILVLGGAAVGARPLLRRLRARRADAEPEFHVTDRSSSWTIDSALKILMSTCDDEQIVFPGLYMVTVDSSSIHVVLSTPSPTVPSGWKASSDGRTWTSALSYLQTQHVPERTNERFAGLATLGNAPTGRLLLDLDQAHGPISVEGAAASVTNVVESWITELTTNPWSGTPTVVRSNPSGAGNREAFESLLARMESSPSGVAVLDGSPSRSQGETLRALFSAPDFGWIVVVKGGFSGASWKFTAQDGRLTSGFLPDVRYDRGSASRPTAPATIS